MNVTTKIRFSDLRWQYSRNILPPPPSDPPIALFPDGNQSSVGRKRETSKEGRVEKRRWCRSCEVGVWQEKGVCEKSGRETKSAQERYVASRRRKVEANPEAKKQSAAPIKQTSLLVRRTRETHAMKNAFPRENAKRRKTCPGLMDTIDMEKRNTNIYLMGMDASSKHYSSELLYVFSISFRKLVNTSPS